MFSAPQCRLIDQPGIHEIGNWKFELVSSHNIRLKNLLTMSRWILV